jgi:hypothetical protein
MARPKSSAWEAKYGGSVASDPRRAEHWVQHLFGDVLKYLKILIWMWVKMEDLGDRRC